MDATIRRVRQRLVDEAQKVHSDLSETSTGPLDALDIEDPMLEAALTGSAMKFFLDHMTCMGGGDAKVDMQPSLREENLSPGEIRATREILAKLVCAPAPELGLGLHSERLWILIDLLTNGDSHARRRATLELRECVAMIESGEFDEPSLQGLIRGLQSMERTILLDLLLAAAQSTYREEQG